MARAGSWELLGYDFVVDERMHIWLLEVNASPRWGTLAAAVQAPGKHMLTSSLSPRNKPEKGEYY